MSESPPSTDPSFPNSTDSNTQAITHKQNVLYYLKDDPMVIFLVEDQLFKVHRHFFSEGSEVFRGMFACPVGEGMDPEGTTNERPISLPGVTVKEFEALLNYFYQKPHWKPKYSKIQRLWISLDLLSISHRFAFDEIFQHVLEKLEPDKIAIPAIQRFSLGKKYGLEGWWSSAYKTLLDRPTSLTVHEVEVLGSETVVEYMKDREVMRGTRLQAGLKKEAEKYDARLQAELNKEIEKYEARLQAELVRERTQKVRFSRNISN